MTNNPRVPFDDLLVVDDQSHTWQGNPFTGTAYETNQSGKVIGEAGFVDGLQQGAAREWSDSGQLLSETTYAQGAVHGISRSWHDNNQLESKLDYRYSIAVREKRWNREGMLIKDWSMPENDKNREFIDMYEKYFKRAGLYENYFKPLETESG